WRVCPSLRRMIAPLPYSFSTLAMASSRDAVFCLAFFSFLSSLMVGDLCCPAAGDGARACGGGSGRRTDSRTGWADHTGRLFSVKENGAETGRIGDGEC